MSREDKKNTKIQLKRKIIESSFYGLRRLRMYSY